jgi:hypothetical protein
VAVFGVVVFQALLVQGQARLDHLNSQITQQRQESNQLRFQLAQLEAPDRIATRAAQLGMIDPGNVVYLAPSPDDDAKAALTPSAAATATTSAPAARPATPSTTAPTTRTRPSPSTTPTSVTIAPAGQATRP